MDRRRATQRAYPWLIALSTMLLAAAVPLGFVSWLTDEPLELRVVVTGDELSTLIVDGRARTLVIHSDDREETTVALGILARPWERGPGVLIAPASDRAAVGLWESLQRTDPSSVIVAGIPGAEPIWSEIEALCRTRGIELRYVAGTLTFDTNRASVTVFGSGQEAGYPMAIVVRSGSVNVVIALDVDAPDIDAQIAIANVVPGLESLAVLIAANPAPTRSGLRQVVASERDLVRVQFVDERVRILGGELLPGTNARPTETDSEGDSE